VLATRDEGQLGELRAALARYDLEVVAYPVLREVDHYDPAAWTAVAARRDSVRVLALTSPRAAAALVAGAARHGLVETFARLPVAAIGKATAAAAEAAGLAVAEVGGGGGGELAGLILGRWGSAGAVLHSCGRDHRPELAARLRAAGVEVIELPVYAVELVPATELPPLPPTLPVAVVVSSPRAVEGYHAAAAGRFAGVPHVAYGAATAAAVARLGLGPVAVAGAEVERLVEEICQTC